MKKIFLIFLISLFLFSAPTSANFEEQSKENFKKSPSISEIISIEDPVMKFCEETYLQAYMRREFTKLENEICSEIFVKKQEEEYLYKKFVLKMRY